MTAPATTFQGQQDISSTTSSAGPEKEVIVKRVCEVSEPDRIYRLGTVGVETRINSLFVVNAAGCHQVAHYFLLVLESTKLETHEVQERIEGHCKLTTPVIALVIKSEEFTTWLHKSHPFACTVAARAELLYNSSARLEAPPPTNGQVAGEYKPRGIQPIKAAGSLLTCWCRIISHSERIPNGGVHAPPGYRMPAAHCPAQPHRLLLPYA